MFKNLFRGSSKSKSIEERVSAIEERLGIKPTVESDVEEAPLMVPEPPGGLLGDVKPPMGGLDKPPMEPPMGGLDKPPMGGLDKPLMDPPMEPPMGGLDNPLGDVKPPMELQGNIKPVGGRKSKKGTRKGKRPEGKKTRGR